MKYGICKWMSIAMRATPSHKSEMISQLLFGECYQVEEETSEWLKIKSEEDNYEGWISRIQHTETSDSEYKQWKNTEPQIIRTLFQFVRNRTTNNVFPIFIGSKIPDNRNGFIINGEEYITENKFAYIQPEHKMITEKADQLLAFAFQYLNTPYLWGGRTPAGIDCSGFTQIAFRSVGIILPRDAAQQVNHGSVVDFLSEARIGDIAFFDNIEGKIVHVGILCGNGKIIHASGHVQVNTLDDNGIFNQQIGKYTHHLRIIKRILE